jgi:Transposase DDE domain group 1
MTGRRNYSLGAPLAVAEFTTLRMRLIKIAARILETASRVRVALAAAHPEAALFASLSASAVRSNRRLPMKVSRGPG